MKILAAITVVALILVLAWTQNRAIQNSNGTSPSEQGLAESAVDQQNQEKQTTNIERNAMVKRSGNTAVQSGGTRAYNPSSAQRSARTKPEQTQFNRSVASRNSPDGVPYNHQSQRQEQRAAQQRHYDQQRYAQQRASSKQQQRAYANNPPSRVASSTTRPPQETTSGRQGIAYEDGPEYSAASRGQNAESLTYRSASQGYQATSDARGSGAYNQPVAQPETRESIPQSYQETRAPSYVQNQQPSSEPTENQSAYRKDSESENCVYKDGKIYCR